jgi:hypothetical protein
VTGAWNLPKAALRPLSLARRKAILKRLAKGTKRWAALVDGMPGQGRRPFELRHLCNQRMRERMGKQVFGT